MKKLSFRIRCDVRMLTFLFTLAGIVCFLTDCSKQSRSAVKTEILQKQKLTYRILLVLGKDFEQDTRILNLVQALYTEESIRENIRLLSYAEMTAKTKQPRLSMITEALAAQPADVLISAGIPEGGGRILIAAKETYPQLHIISLLPVEEILPLEACSTIVADFQLHDSPADLDKETVITSNDLQMLVLAAVVTGQQRYEFPEQSPFERFSRALSTAAAHLRECKEGYPETAYQIKPYTDPELNIQSYNCFILSTASNAPLTEQGALAHE